MPKVAHGLSVAVSCLVILGNETTAAAHGSFPGAGQLATNVSNPNELLIRTSFGLVISHDRGAHFSWSCEDLFGSAPTSDPTVVILGDDTYAAGSYGGLATSRTRGCSFESEPRLVEQYVRDIVVQRNDPSRAVAITATLQQQQRTYQIELYESSNYGRAWTKFGTPIDETFFVDAIEVSPKRPERIYVSGTYDGATERRGAIWVSDDRGATWNRTSLGRADSTYVVGSDPTDADRVYVRTNIQGATENDLVVTDDGFATYRTLVKVPEREGFAFAVSPDGAQIMYAGRTTGVFVADRASSSFTNVSNEALECLVWNADALYGCGSTTAGGKFFLGRSTDGGHVWAPVLRSYLDIDGLADCKASTEYATACIPQWPPFATPVTPPVAGTPEVDAGTSGNADQGPRELGDLGCTLAAPPGRPRGRPYALPPSTDDVGLGTVSALAVATLALAVGTRRRRRDAGRERT